jgi:preprotein translocase subunit SecE
MRKFKFIRDIEESYNELVHKVSWPTRSELANSTVVVMVASIVLAIVIWLVDLGIDSIMHFIYNLNV